MRNSLGITPAKEAGRQKNKTLPVVVLLLGPNYSGEGYREKEGRMDVKIHTICRNYLLAGKDQGRSPRSI